MNDDLNKLPFTIKLSRKTLRIIKQNITFSLTVKLLALLLVVPGWLTLWIAIFADMGTTLLVTLNGLRLLREKDSSSRIEKDFQKKIA
jgi:Cd2+/Zn2+-exporting ATPase